MKKNANVPTDAWNALHVKSGISPRFPQDSVVRWTFKTFGNPLKRQMRMLDLGAGNGRHSIFLAQLGHSVTACDYAQAAIDNAAAWAADANVPLRTVRAEVDDLPFESESFEAAICFGVLCYLEPASLRRAIAELHRVLVPGGRALIVTRTTSDSRYAMSAVRSGHRAIVPDGLDVPWQVEVGMNMTFLSRDDVMDGFSAFAEIELNRMAFSQAGDKFLNDDWLINVIR